MSPHQLLFAAWTSIAVLLVCLVALPGTGIEEWPWGEDRPGWNGLTFCAIVITVVFLAVWLVTR